jgi:hypothetical protein
MELINDKAGALINKVEVRSMTAYKYNDKSNNTINQAT